MDMLPVPTNHNLYKDHHTNSEVQPHSQPQLPMPIPLPVLQNDPATLQQLGLNPNIPNFTNMNMDDMKLKSEFDEESNNGPLDFSLHRIQDIVFNNRSNSVPKRSKAPRVKLTLRETSEQRERRLHKGRERMRNLRANESTDEREVRLLKARKCQERRRQKERELESSQERELRLSKARDRTRLRREQESQDQREKRLRTTRERLRFKRMTESFEERQRRLFLQRQRKKEKYHKMTPEEKEMMRLNERHSKQYKLDPNQERRQTRGICIKYDTFEDDLDEALLKIQNEAQHMTNDSEDGSWLAEPEVCLSVGSLDSYSPDKNGSGGSASTASKENADISGQPPSGNSVNTNNVTESTSSSSSTPTSTMSKASVIEAVTTTTSTSATSTAEVAPTPTVATSTAVPPPQDLQEQLSQHISSVALNISDTSKSSYEDTPTYSKINPCYPQMLTNSHANESYTSYSCNNNQAEYIKENTSSSCAPVSTSNYSVYHSGGAARENRYQYCTQGYPQPQTDNQPPVSEGYSNRTHPVYSQTSQPMTHQPVPHHTNYSDHEAPLNLQQHHTQMLPRYGTGVCCPTEMRN